MLIEWWEAWLVIAITVNTTINVLVFFGGRKIKKDSVYETSFKGAGVSNDKTNSNKIHSDCN